MPVKKSTTKKIKVKKASKNFYFTENKIKPDYKDVLILRRFLSERGKILSQDATGLSAKLQRAVAQQIKKARFMALLPYTDKHAL